MADPEQLRLAYERLAWVVERWAEKKPWLHRELDEFELQLKDAAYEIRRAKAATGSLRVGELVKKPEK
jgi:hypothetical protein